MHSDKAVNYVSLYAGEKQRIFFTLGEATKFHVEVFFQAEDGSHSPSEIKFVAEGVFFGT